MRFLSSADVVMVGWAPVASMDQDTAREEVGRWRNDHCKYGTSSWASCLIHPTCPKLNGMESEPLSFSSRSLPTPPRPYHNSIWRKRRKKAQDERADGKTPQDSGGLGRCFQVGIGSRASHVTTGPVHDKEEFRTSDDPLMLHAKSGWAHMKEVKRLAELYPECLEDQTFHEW